LYFLSSSAYTKALDDAIAVLDKIAMAVDVNDRKFTVNIYFCTGSWHFVNGTGISSSLLHTPCVKQLD
jgi:hypothetical protein